LGGGKRIHGSGKVGVKGIRPVGKGNCKNGMGETTTREGGSFGGITGELESQSKVRKSVGGKGESGNRLEKRRLKKNFEVLGAWGAREEGEKEGRGAHVSREKKP